MATELGGLFALDVEESVALKPIKAKKKSKTLEDAEAMSQLLALHNEFVVLDIETTGLTPQKGGKIIEIGAVKVSNNAIVEQYSQFIYPESKIYKKTIELTGITNEMLAGQPVYGKVLPEFHQFIGNHPIVAHNAIFDWDRFLIHYFEKVGLKVQNKVIDTLKLSKLYHPSLKSHKLSELCLLYGVELNNAHRAIYDAIATAEVLIHIKKAFIKSREIYDEETVKEVIKTNTPDKKKSFKIRKITYWEKPVTQKRKLQRIYVNIAIGNVYFDILTQTWYNKDVKVPICFESLEKQVLKTLNLNTQVDLCFYRN